MQVIRKNQWSSAVTFVAACFLILQSLSGAFALTIWPQTMQLDAFGNVICTHQGISEPTEGHTPTALPDCCLLGCNLAAPVVGNTPSPESLRTQPTLEKINFKKSVPDHLSFMRQRSPANPRAPPALV